VVPVRTYPEPQVVQTPVVAEAVAAAQLAVEVRQYPLLRPYPALQLVHAATPGFEQLAQLAASEQVVQ